jgi:hypothetical protein
MDRRELTIAISTDAANLLISEFGACPMLHLSKASMRVVSSHLSGLLPKCLLACCELMFDTSK